MAGLTARFSMIDDMSDKLAGMAELGQTVLGQWSQAGETANAAFDGLAGAAATAVTTADGVATSINGLQEAAGELSKSTQEASEQADKAGDSGQNAVEGIATALAAAGITAK